MRSPPRRSRGVSCVCGCRSVSFGEGLLAGPERVDEVVYRVDVLHRGREGVYLERIADGNLDVLAPGLTVKTDGVPHEAADGMSVAEQAWDKPAPDVPCCPGNENVVWRGRGHDRIGHLTENSTLRTLRKLHSCPQTCPIP